MDIGTVLIYLSLISGLIALVISTLNVFTKNKRFENYYYLFIIICISTITIAYLLLVNYFLDSNFGIHYVWAHSSKSLDWTLKIAGTWAGQEGSMLLWVWLILISFGIEEYVQFRKLAPVKSDTASSKVVKSKINDNSDQIIKWVRIIMLCIVLVFLVILITKDPFEPTHDMWVQTSSSGDGEYVDPLDPPPWANGTAIGNWPNGYGMNPTLRNPWMVIHPPILFIGYALVTLPFAACLAYSVTDDKRWTSIALPWSRLSWLFLTLGIGFGAVWAYIALGWGGYWSWDPVEVGSLVPWITLTAFLHTQLMNKRKNEYPIITPLFGMVTFVLIIFATFITRSGYWESVHAWEESEVGLILMIFMVGIIFFSILIILLSFFKHQDEAEVKLTQSFFGMFGAIIMFALITIIIFIGLITTMNKSDPEYFETRLFPFTVILLLVTSSCLIGKYLSKGTLFTIVEGILIAGVACALFLPVFIFPGTSEPFYTEMITTHHIVGFMIPVVLFAIFAAMYKLKKTINFKAKKRMLKAIGPSLIHLGVALIILGYGASQTMVVEKSALISEGQVMKFNGYELELIEIDHTAETDKAIFDFVIEIQKDGNMLGRAHPKWIYYSDSGEWYGEIDVLNAVIEDLYLIVEDWDPDGNGDIDLVLLTAKTIPMMNCLWGGIWFMVGGIGIRIVIGFSDKFHKNGRRR